jgi:NTE family protein
MLAVDPDAATRLKERPRYVHLMGGGRKTSVTRIVRTGSGAEPPATEYDFSMQTIDRHKREGYLTAKKLLAAQAEKLGS